MALNSKSKVLLAIVRLGAASVKQLREIFVCDFHFVHLYRILNSLKKDGQIIRVSHPKSTQFALVATDVGRRSIYGPIPVRYLNTKENELSHTLAVGDAVIELSKYSNVKGVFAEHEFELTRLNQIIVGRRPDAIVKIVKNNIENKIALEVEYSTKTDERIERILSAYNLSFSNHLQCKGVIVAVHPNSTFEAYSRLLKDKSESLKEKVLLIRPNGFSTLNEQTFGHKRGLQNSDVNPMLNINTL